MPLLLFVFACGLLFLKKLNIFIYFFKISFIFRDREREGEELRPVALHARPHLGPNPQPKPLP